jgi:hypothetical protein
MSFPQLNVLVVSNTKAAGANTTKRWFDTINQYLEDSPELVIDNLGGHHNKEFKSELAHSGITVKFFPDQSGKYLNPCDNSIQHVIRQEYLKQPRSTHQEMIAAIAKAYSAVSEATILNSFIHTGIASKNRPSAIIRYLKNQGFIGHKGHEREIKKMITHYKAWKKKVRFLRNPEN